jgi:hypothetical protein
MMRSILILIFAFSLSPLAMAGQDVLDKTEDVLDKTKDVVIDEPADKIEDVFDDEDKKSNDPAEYYRQKLTNTTDCRQTLVAAPGADATPVVITMEELEKNPENYYGKIVTVDGEMHRTFTPTVFTIEDDGFFRDKDVLVISNAPTSQVAVALDDDGSIERGKDVRVTGVVQPYDRGMLECAYGPLHLESRESHSFTKNPVIIVDRTVAAKMEPPVLREKPMIIPEAAPLPPPPAPEPAPQPAPEPPKMLPKTAGDLPLMALAGLLALSAGSLIRRYRWN